MLTIKAGNTEIIFAASRSLIQDNGEVANNQQITHCLSQLNKIILRKNRVEGICFYHVKSHDSDLPLRSDSNIWIDKYCSYKKKKTEKRLNNVLWKRKVIILLILYNLNLSPDK